MCQMAMENSCCCHTFVLRSSGLGRVHALTERVVPRHKSEGRLISPKQGAEFGSLPKILEACYMHLECLVGVSFVVCVILGGSCPQGGGYFGSRHAILWSFSCPGRSMDNWKRYRLCRLLGSLRSLLEAAVVSTPSLAPGASSKAACRQESGTRQKEKDASWEEAGEFAHRDKLPQDGLSVRSCKSWRR